MSNTNAIITKLFDEVFKLPHGRVIALDDITPIEIVIHAGTLPNHHQELIKELFGSVIDLSDCVLQISYMMAKLTCYEDLILKNLPSAIWSQMIYANGKVSSLYYSNNKPLLHLKYQLFSPDHIYYERWSNFSMRCRELGLFDDFTRIGTQDRWNELVAEKDIII